MNERIYLYVPPEEYAGVRASGGFWDTDSKRWFIHGDMARADFSRWLNDDEDDEELQIAADGAFVAATHTACAECHANFEVICIYCESAVDRESGDSMTGITLCNIWKMDHALTRQLARWPLFKKEAGLDAHGGCFANHCPQCGTQHDDHWLHSEPGDVFFDIDRADPGPIEFIPLQGSVQLSGDYSVAV